MEYYNNGQLNSIGRYENDKATGEWKIYHKNSTLYQIRLWSKGKLMDIISCYDNKGNALDKGTLVNGNGTVDYYDDTGKLTDIKTFKNGEKQK